MQARSLQLAVCSLQVPVSEMLLLMMDDAVGDGPRGGCQSGMAGPICVARMGG